MDLARLYEHHAEDCARSAEKIDNPSHRAMLLKAAAEWRVAAQIQRQSIQPSQAEPPSKAGSSFTPQEAGKGSVIIPS
jgi:hypothetical protein